MKRKNAKQTEKLVTLIRQKRRKLKYWDHVHKKMYL